LPLLWVLSFWRKNNIESCKNLEILIRKHPSGWKRLLILENSAARSIVSAATAASSRVTTARSLITAPGRSAASFGS